MVRHGYLTDLHVFLLAFKGKVQRLGWFHADIWEALTFWTEHCHRREESFICVASIQIEQYLPKLDIQCPSL